MLLFLFDLSLWWQLALWERHLVRLNQDQQMRVCVCVSITLQTFLKYWAHVEQIYFCEQVQAHQWLRVFFWKNDILDKSYGWQSLFMPRASKVKWERQTWANSLTFLWVFAYVYLFGSCFLTTCMLLVFSLHGRKQNCLLKLDCIDPWANKKIIYLEVLQKWASPRNV